MKRVVGRKQINFLPPPRVRETKQNKNLQSKPATREKKRYHHKKLKIKKGFMNRKFFLSEYEKAGAG